MKDFWANISKASDGSDATMAILLMLFGAFILGFLLKWVLGGNSSKYKTELEETKATNNRLRDELDSVKKKAAKADALSGVQSELDTVRRKNRQLEKDLLTASAAAPGIDADSSDEIDALKRTNDNLNKELEDCRTRAAQVNSSSGNSLAVAGGLNTSKELTAPAAKPNSTDDLTKVEGIGKKIQEHLNNGGIWNFDQLASAHVSRLQEILNAAGPAYTMHDPGTWPEQGSMARAGEWEKLQKWQQELKGGRKRKR